MSSTVGVSSAVKRQDAQAIFTALRRVRSEHARTQTTQPAQVPAESKLVHMFAQQRLLTSSVPFARRHPALQSPLRWFPSALESPLRWFPSSRTARPARRPQRDARRQSVRRLAVTSRHRRRRRRQADDPDPVAAEGAL